MPEHELADLAEWVVRQPAGHWGRWDPQDAEDAVQDALLRALEAPWVADCPQAFFKQAVANRLLDLRRRAKAGIHGGRLERVSLDARSDNLASKSRTVEEEIRASEDS